jgi:signal peptidase I
MVPIFAAVALLCVLAALVARRGYFVVAIEGRSMEPQYFHGDRLLVSKLRSSGRLRVGDVVVVRRAAVHSYGGRTHKLFVKNLVATPGDEVPGVFHALARASPNAPEGCFLVLGRHQASEDSKQWGYVTAEDISGRVVRFRSRRGSAANAVRV